MPQEKQNDMMHPGISQGTRAQRLVDKLRNPTYFSCFDVNLYWNQVGRSCKFQPMFSHNGAKLSRTHQELDPETFHKCATDHYTIFDPQVFFATFLLFFGGPTRSKSCFCSCLHCGTPDSRNYGFFISLRTVTRHLTQTRAPQKFEAKLD